MTTLKINDIEWESLGSVVSVRYMEFLKEHLSESKEFFYMGETKEEIKAEIDKIVYMLGQEPTDDLN